MTKAIFAVAAALVMGCATTGHEPSELDPSRASALEPGVATLEDAKRLLGEPAYTSIQEGNKLLCVWTPAASDGQMSMSSKSVTLTFGPDGRLLGSP